MTEENNLKFRFAEIEDAPLLADIGWQAFDEAFADHPANHPDDMQIYMNEAFSAATIASELKDEKTIYLIAGTNGETAGYLKLKFDSREDCVANGKTIELCRLYALDRFIGKGIGKSLMLEFLNIAREKNCEIAWLGVWEFNHRAQKFYEKFGFEKCGEHVFQLGKDPQIDWILQKRI